MVEVPVPVGCGPAELPLLAGVEVVALLALSHLAGESVIAGVAVELLQSRPAGTIVCLHVASLTSEIKRGCFKKLHRL